MGRIEIHDAVGSRTVRVDDLDGIVRIEVGGDGPTEVVVPEGVEVNREATRQR